MSVSERSDILPNAAITAQSRTMSVGVSSSYAKRRVTSGLVSRTLESNTDDQVTSLDLGLRFPATKKKATRPKSAPVVRPDTLEMMMENNRVIHSGDTTLPRRTLVHPPISPSDPLSLSSRANHLSGRPQAVSPPAFNSLYKARPSPHFPTLNNRTAQSHPVTSPTNNLSRSSLPEEQDSEHSVSDIRSRTWTEPPKSLRSQEVQRTLLKNAVKVSLSTLMIQQKSTL
jgi:hypothetical protein